jgi:serine protease
VLGEGGGTTADIADGILFAAGLTNSSGQVPAQRADVVNMSLGAPGVSAVLQQACDAAAAAGCLLVAAAGNDNSGDPGSPAVFDSVLSVGAVDLVKARAPYSNFHTSVDIWAPGGDMTADLNADGFPDGVLSCGADDQGNTFFVFENGTSMASPHVAGVAALVKAAAPSLNASQIRSVLLSSTAAGSGLPNGGRVVDALAAVQGAGGAASSPLLVATPSSVDFGASSTQATTAMENRGTGSLTFQGVSFSPAAPWLSQQTFNDTANNIDIDRIVWTANRSGLANGVHQTVATLTYGNGAPTFTVDVTFRVQVGGDSTSNDTVFVLLVDPDTFDTAFQTTTTAASGFAYTFTGVTPGDYLLAAGTDRNNDNDISDLAELFGVWPSLDQLLVLSVVAGDVIDDLDFALEEQATVSSLANERRVFRRLR